MKLDVLQKQKSFTIDAIIGKDKETVDKKTETVSSACAQTASPVFQSCYSANLRRNLAASSLEIMRTLSSERNLFSGSWLIPPTTYPLSQFALGNIQQKLVVQDLNFLQPYRKPKRIRTAFSPSQLLQLEHAFEKNHYVVGQERKQLASNLCLTETQVKVWFQNRRTKYKRTKEDILCDVKNVDNDICESD